MPRTEGAGTWLLTPLLAFAGTAVGTAALFFAESALARRAAGGYGTVCDAPDCGLGAGLMLIATGFLAVVVALLVGLRTGVRQHHERAAAPAVRRGLKIAVWCVVGYLAASAIVWTVV